MRILLFVAVATLSLSVCGCKSYMKDRAADFLDIGGLEVSAGLQVGANVRATKFAQVGLLGATGDCVAWDGRTFAQFEENRQEVGISLFYHNYAERAVTRCNKAYRENDGFATEANEEWYDALRVHDRGFFEVGGRVGLGFLGIDAHLDVFQIADLIFGLVGIDMGRDDTRNADRTPVSSPPQDGWPELKKSMMEKKG